MAVKKFLPQATVALLLFCATVSLAQAASVEALLADINQLPPAERQQRLEEGARSCGPKCHRKVPKVSRWGKLVSPKSGGISPLWIRDWVFSIRPIPATMAST
jgi:hypothetical protein